MLGMDPIVEGQQIISAEEISKRIEVLEGWVDNRDLIRRYAEGAAFDDLPWTVDDAIDEEEADELLALYDLAEQIRSCTNGELEGSLISEGYWNEYASNDADEHFDLEKTGAYKYFNYDAYADDLITDYSTVTYGDTTYYLS